MGNEHGKMQGVVTPAGIQSMDETLQRKFAKGIQFNMKIVIRGDRNTGKSCLFQRMQGKPFTESYHPTNEIQVMSIMWSYKVTSDTVKVEVWDVVDKGRALQKKGSKGTLKLVNAPSQDGQDASEVPLDAAFLDVYKGAHGAVFVFDMTKQWTWKYVERELPRVPLHIPVIIMSNFRDMGEHRVISREECLMFIQQLDRPEGAAEVRYAESSMKDGYGLMHLHKFLSVPFLQLQQEALLQQLQVNREQMLGATEELNSASSTEDQNYELFQAKLQRIAEERRKKVQEQQELQARAESDPVSPIRRDTASAPPPQEAPPHPPRPPSQTDSSPKRRSGSFGSKLGSKFSGLLSRNKEDKKTPDSPKTVPPRAPRQPSTTNVYDFVPEGEVDTQFFEAGEEEEEEESEEESDEDEADNPLVAMAEDLSSPEEEEPEPPKSHSSTAASKSAPRPSRPAATLKSAKDVELTESEEEDSTEEEDAPVPEQRPRETKKGPDPFEMFLAKTSPSNPPTSAPKPSKKKSTGLLLAFPEPSITVGGSKELQEKEKGTAPAMDSPDLLGEEKRERKKKKSKKSKQKPVEDTDAGSSRPAVAQPVPSEDPFGLTSSLNAWLNAGQGDTSNLGEVLQPTQVSKSGVEVGQEEEEGEEETRDNKRKKHKHRRHREDGEGSHRRKHKHRSRRSDQTEPGDYNIMDI